MKNRNQLAANTVDGTYVCENPSASKGVDVLVDEDFYAALSTVKDGETIYGNVSDEWAQRIEAEYGIR